ncbi:MAG: FAD-dependent oxidoreductase [Thermodesulfobacteriota bacterium]
MMDAEIVIIGGGPAGMAAALEAARRGISTVLIDENKSLGGRVLQSLEEPGNSIRREWAEEQVRKKLFQAFDGIRDRVRVLLGTTVWGIFDRTTVAFFSEDGASASQGRVRARKLILNTGAIDRVVPFPGWTLPGVFTAGGLNQLVKYQNVLPGKRFLLAGSGPLQLVLANQLLQAGAKIAGVVEAGSYRDVLGNIYSLLSGGRLMTRGMKYFFNIRRHRVPVYSSHVIVEAKGGKEVEGAVIARVDRSWRPIEGTRKEISADVIALAYGLIPSTELARLCGCNQRFDNNSGYFEIEHDQNMATSVPGIFVAGDGATIKGYPAAIEEGRIAGLAACAQLGCIDPKEADRLTESSQKKLARWKKFSAAMNSISAPRPGIIQTISDETVVCRCEEVTMGDLRAAVRSGATDINHIKRKTRSGMGYCQGRFCGQVINELIWGLSGDSRPREVFTARVPVRPIPIEVLLR